MHALLAQVEEFIAERNKVSGIIRCSAKNNVPAYLVKVAERRLEWLERAIANITSQLEAEVA
jgi:hypothetical protein